MTSRLPRDEWVETRDGRRLFAQRIGPSERTDVVVVFEAGMGASRNVWGAVVDELSSDVACVVYDRSGLGRSEPDPSAAGERDLARLASDLVDVMGAVDAERCILVGHSWGGPIIRIAAAARPELVVGLVLVDQTDEHCDLFFTPSNHRQTRIAIAVTPLLARLGLTRLFARRVARMLPAPWGDQMRREDGTVAATAAQVAELRHHIADLAALRDRPLVVPDVAVVVISGARTSWIERARRPALIEAHRASVRMFPQGRHVEAHASGHHVPLTEPRLIADEIRRMIEQI